MVEPLTEEDIKSIARRFAADGMAAEAALALAVRELERELADARAEMTDIMRWWKEELEEAKRQHDRLAEALGRYGRHEAGCCVNDPAHGKKCTCGYYKALAGGEGA